MVLVLEIEDSGLSSSAFVYVLAVPNRKFVVVVDAVVNETLEELASKNLVINHTE